MMEWTTEHIKRLQDELDAYRNGGVTEEILRRNGGFIKLGNGCTIVREEERAKWTTQKPSRAGWYWARWPKQPQYGAEILEITQPNGPDTDLAVDRRPFDWNLDEYIKDEGPVEWQGPLEPKEPA